MSLKVWLPLNGTVENKGISDITVTNNSAIIDASGKIGSCYSFNGNNYYISLAGQQLFDCFKGSTYPFSMCMWVYHADARRAILFGDWNLSNSIGFNIELNTSHNVRFYWNGSPDYATGVHVEINKWSHLAFTYDGTTLKTYLDGTLAATREGTLAARSKTAGEFRLGRDSRTTDTALNGKLNDFRIYDHCLSAAEVKEISQGLILHYKLDRFSGRPGVNPNLLSGKVNETSAWVADGVTLTKDIETDSLKVVDNGTSYRRIYNNTTNVWLTSGEKFTVSFKAKGATSGIKLKVSRSVVDMGNSDISLQTTWTSFFRTITNTGSGITGGTLSIQSTTDNAVFWIKDIKLEKGTSQTAFIQPGEQPYWIGDSSGYNHNGTIIGNLNFNSGNGRYSAYMRIPDNTGHIQCGVITTSGFSNSYTFAWWGTKSAASTMFWGFQDGIRLNGLYNNTLWNTGDSSNNPIYNIGTTTIITAPTVTEWHHYAMTGNGTKCYLYVDGQLYGEAKTYKSISGTKLWINGWQNSTNYAGYMNISDFRVYCTALDADAIRQLYELGAKIDNKQNLHTYELYENRSLSTITALDTTYTYTSSSYTCGNYRTASNTQNQYTTAYLSCNSYSYLSPKIPVKDGLSYNISLQSGNSIKSYNTSYLPYVWQYQNGQYRRVAQSTQYFRYIQAQIFMRLYDENNSLISSISLYDYTASQTSSSSLNTTTHTLTSMSKTISIPSAQYSTSSKIAYIEIIEYYRGTNPTIQNHTTIKEYNTNYGVKLLKKGILDTPYLEENTNTKIIKPHIVETNNLIEF